MKIAANPMDYFNITEEKLRTTPAGVQVLALLEEGINKGFYGEKTTIKSALKDLTKSNVLRGSCLGQASSVILAHESSLNKNPKVVVKKAKKVDQIAFQIFENLRGDIARKFSSPGDGTLHFKKFRKFAKYSPKILSKEKFSAYGKFYDKLVKIGRELIEKQTNLKFVSLKKFSSANKFYTGIKKIVKENKKNQILRVYMKIKRAGHAIAFFMQEKLNIYDSGIGYTEHKNSKDFLEFIKKTYAFKDSLYQKQDTPVMTAYVEIFKNKA